MLGASTARHRSVTGVGSVFGAWIGSAESGSTRRDGMHPFSCLIWTHYGRACNVWNLTDGRSIFALPAGSVISKLAGDSYAYPCIAIRQIRHPQAPIQAVNSNSRTTRRVSTDASDACHAHPSQVPLEAPIGKVLIGRRGNRLEREAQSAGETILGGADSASIQLPESLRRLQIPSSPQTENPRSRELPPLFAV